MPPTSTLPTWLSRALAALGDADIDRYVEMYAPDAVHEFPFAPDGGVGCLEGRDAIAAYMRQIPGRVRLGSMSDVRVREAGDEVIVEATGHHHRVADGMPRTLNYVWFITRRSGQVTHFRDYMNPLQLEAL